MTDIHSCSLYCDRPECIKAQRDELRDKLAQPEREPVAWGVFEGNNMHDMFFSKEEADHMAQLKGVHAEVRPLVTPQQRAWVGLTEEDKADILNRKWWDFEDMFDVDGFLRLAEAKLKEKNT